MNQTGWRIRLTSESLFRKVYEERELQKSLVIWAVTTAISVRRPKRVAGG